MSLPLPTDFKAAVRLVLAQLGVSSSQAVITLSDTTAEVTFRWRGEDFRVRLDWPYGRYLADLPFGDQLRKKLARVLTTGALT